MPAEAEATADHRAAYHEIAHLTWKQRPAEARRLLYPIARQLEVDFAEGRFRREDWEKLAELHEGLDEFGAAATALETIETKCGWEPLTFLRRLRLRGAVELPTVVYEEFAARRADLPQTPEVMREAVKFVRSLKLPAGFSDSSWHGLRHALEDEWMQAAPNDPDAFRDAAGIAIHLKDFRRARPIVDKLRALLIRQADTASALHWARLSELEEKLDRDALSLDAAVRGFRIEPGSLYSLRRVGRFYPAVNAFLEPAAIDAGFAKALGNPSMTADHLALTAELLVTCDRRDMAAQALARATTLDPHNERAKMVGVALEARPGAGLAAALVGNPRGVAPASTPLARAWRRMTGRR
jgi:hypothetical protein